MQNSLDSQIYDFDNNRSTANNIKNYLNQMVSKSMNSI